MFIDHGADLDARDEEWCTTPLGWAANFGHTRMVEYVLRRGARTRLPDDPPWATPLALAAHRRHTHFVELLTQYERTGALPRHDIAYYEGLVRDLLQASGSGEEAAMGRLAAVFRIARGSFNWAQRTPKERTAKLRRFVVEQLGRQYGSESGREVPVPDDARLLVARAHGFDIWTPFSRRHGEHIMINRVALVVGISVVVLLAVVLGAAREWPSDEPRPTQPVVLD